MRIILVAALLLVLPFSGSAASDRMIIESRPETATIYRDGYGYLEETLHFQSSNPGAIRLPIGTDAGSIILTQNGKPFQGLVIEEEKASLDTEKSVREKSFGYLVSIPKKIAARPSPVSLVLRYLVHGLSWQPQLDITASANENLTVSLKALVRNSAVDLENSRILLASGAGPMGKRSYFEPTRASSHRKNEAPVFGGADTVYDLGRRSIEKRPDAIMMLQIDSSNAKYQTRYLWDTRSKGRIQRLLFIENPFAISLCPANVNLLLDNVLFKAGALDWTAPGEVFTVNAGAETRLLGEKAIITAENPSKHPLVFHHDIKLTVTNKTTAKAIVEVLFEKKLGYRHRNEHRFTKAPDRSPGNWHIWELDIPAGAAGKVEFDVDSDRKDYAEYFSYDFADLGD